MLNDAKGHRFSVVLATKYDRIARSVIDLETIIRELDRSGIELRCIDEPVDTTTPEGVAFRQMLAVMAQLERGLIRDRTKAGLAGARARGKRLGRPRCPIDLERVHELREQGLGLRRIARQMDVSHQTIRNRLRKEGRRSPIENESTEGGQTNG
jgi:DNA invertase Pin-like site-specific DNA recombinase